MPQFLLRRTIMDINTSIVGVMFIIMVASGMCGYFYRKCTVEAGSKSTIIFIVYLLAIIAFNGYYIIMSQFVKQRLL